MSLMIFYIPIIKWFLLVSKKVKQNKFAKRINMGESIDRIIEINKKINNHWGVL